MIDIFLSYSSKDRERAAMVAQALAARGWSVWWDRTIPPGRQYDDVIEEALAEARCAVVLWSKTSASSAWVKNEASEALDKKALIPAVIEDQVKIPFEFRRVQAADLSRWHGETESPEFVQFCDAIASELRGIGPAPGPMPEPLLRPSAPAPLPVAAPASAAKRSKKPYVIGGGIVLGLVVIAALTSQPQPGPTPAPMPSPPPAPIVEPAPAPAPSPSPAPSPAPAPAPPPAPAPARAPSPSPLPIAKAKPIPPAPRPVLGVQQNLQWRDHALSYAGRVNWDGSSNQAFIGMNVFDTMTSTSLGSRQLTASVRPYGRNQIVMSTVVAVIGDSVTRGPHTHSVNLIFQSRPDGGWSFVHNCMSPNDCY